MSTCVGPVTCVSVHTSTAPARVVIHVHLQTKPMGFGNHMFEHLTPLWTGERHRSHSNTLIHLHNKHTTDAHALHGFEVGSNAFVCDVAVQPEPVNPGARPARRISEPGFQRLRLCGASDRNTTKQHTEPALHVSPSGMWIQRPIRNIMFYLVDFGANPYRWRRCHTSPSTASRITTPFTTF
jgi:hypothetical protein